MEPKIIKLEKLAITGISGDGAKTFEVWSDFDSRFNENPFKKITENGYEIRFWESRFSGKKPDLNKSVHVGFFGESDINNGGYTTVVLPESEYAVFVIYVANGYDSGNADMEKWLLENKFIYGIREFDGYEYIIEIYGEKFKNGNQEDSIVEILLPVFRFCQSCYMPMVKSSDFCIDINGQKNPDYCCYCGCDFKNSPSLQEFVEENIQFWRDGCKNDDEAKTRMLEVFPNLKRWKV